jgi:hypothetical protein
MMRSNRIFSTETVIPRETLWPREHASGAVARKLSALLLSLGVVEKPRIVKAEIIEEGRPQTIVGQAY